MQDVPTSKERQDRLQKLLTDHSLYGIKISETEGKDGSKWEIMDRNKDNILRQVRDREGNLVRDKDIAGGRRNVVFEDVMRVPTYMNNFITPYIHVICIHIAFHLSKHKHFHWYSCQSLELQNNHNGQIFFRSNSRRTCFLLEMLTKKYIGRWLTAERGVHLREGEHVCNWCGKDYIHEGRLRNHMAKNCSDDRLEPGESYHFKVYRPEEMISLVQLQAKLKEIDERYAREAAASN
eukprot:g42631.t1